MFLKFKFSVFLLYCFYNLTFAQIPSNTLFIVIDKTSKSIKLDYNEGVKIRYTIWNENKNWYSYLSHSNYSESKRNHFKYLLPKEMFEEFKDRGNVMTSDEFEAMLMSLNIGQAEDLIRLRYPRYYYEYVDDNVYNKNLRYGVFLIFKSDLDNDYIECSEVSLIFDRIEQH